ncbi:Mg2+ transporter protein cora-like protein, partial [Gaertneriomyces semiglobifer]
FDIDGNLADPIEGEFSKVGICAAYSLQPRDLRNMDNSYSDQLPTILVREKAIVVNLLHYRALIRADMIILADSIDSKHYTKEFLEELSWKLKISEGQYEFRALETILLNVTAALQAEEAEVFALANRALDRLDERIDEVELKGLLQVRRIVSKFQSKVESIRNVFIEILHNDEDLAAMYLTDKAAGQPHDIADHMEAELIFEHYLNLTDEISNACEQLSTNIEATQDILNIMLDSRRNQLINYELKATVATVSLSAGSVMVGMFGMNLISGLEATPGVFWGVAGLVVVVATTSYALATLRLRRLWDHGKWRKGAA